MLRLDKNDPLDRLILQEMKGIPVLFDTWLDAMDELAEEPDYTETMLRKSGRRKEDVWKEAKDYRNDFYDRLSRCSVPVESRFGMCTALHSQAVQNPNMELRRIFCEILADPGLLLDTPQQPDNAEDQADYEDQIIGQYFILCQRRDNLLHTFDQRIELGALFSQITNEKRNLKLKDCDTGHSYEIAECFTKLFDLPQKADARILRDNIANVMQMAAASPTLKSAEPLFLFRVLTKHQSRMGTIPDLTIRLPSLWNRDVQQVSRDNGRNFKQFRRNLNFFQKLCQIYQDDPAVNFPLCWYGLDQITVLGDFYRERAAVSWEYEDNLLPFIGVVEELVQDALFCCFEYNDDANVFLQDCDITSEELESFRASCNPPTRYALDKISDYIDERVLELAVQFSQADAEKTKALCRQILEESDLPHPPKSPRELELYLAAINHGLMNCQDWWASYHLIQAGHALLGEPLETLEYLE